MVLRLDGDRISIERIGTDRVLTNRVLIVTPCQHKSETWHSPTTRPCIDNYLWTPLRTPLPETDVLLVRVL